MAVVEEEVKALEAHVEHSDTAPVGFPSLFLAGTKVLEFKLIFWSKMIVCLFIVFHSVLNSVV